MHVLAVLTNLKVDCDVAAESVLYDRHDGGAKFNSLLYLFSPCDLR